MILGILLTDYSSDHSLVPPGGDSSMEMPGCVCWGSENVPILKDALDKKKKKQ